MKFAVSALFNPAVVGQRLPAAARSDQKRAVLALRSARLRCIPGTRVGAAEPRYAARDGRDAAAVPPSSRDRAHGAQGDGSEGLLRAHSWRKAPGEPGGAGRGPRVSAAELGAVAQRR